MDNSDYFCGNHVEITEPSTIVSSPQNDFVFIWCPHLVRIGRYGKGVGEGEYFNLI